MKRSEKELETRNVKEINKIAEQFGGIVRVRKSAGAFYVETAGLSMRFDSARLAALFMRGFGAGAGATTSALAKDLADSFEREASDSLRDK